jgi:hypothetical protein
VDDLSAKTGPFDPKPVHVGYVVKKSGTGTQVLRISVSPATIPSSMLYTHISFIHHGAMKALQFKVSSNTPLPPSLSLSPVFSIFPFKITTKLINRSSLLLVNFP